KALSRRLTPAGVFRNAMVEAACGRAGLGRTPWHSGGRSVDLHRPGRAVPLPDLQALPRRNHYRDADACVSAREPEGTLGALDTSGTDRRSERLGHAGRPADP